MAVHLRSSKRHYLRPQLCRSVFTPSDLFWTTDTQHQSLDDEISYPWIISCPSDCTGVVEEVLQLSPDLVEDHDELANAKLFFQKLRGLNNYGWGTFFLGQK